MNRILLVEDDFYLAKNIRLLLEKEGYEVITAGNTAIARQIIDCEQLDLALIDVMLPDGNGFELCEYIRNKKQFPIIMISAKDDEDSIVRGLETGADDYVTKPFKPKELISRVRANLRRVEYKSNTRIYFCESLEIDIDKRVVRKAGEELVLRNLEYRLLEIFVKNAGIVLKRDVLLAQIWDVDGNFIEDNTLSVSIKRLRQKLGDKEDGASYIDTIRGVGYRWNSAVNER